MTPIPPHLSPGRVFWLYGLSGAGKSTLASAAAEALRDQHHQQVVVLDGDDLRTGLCRDLGFSIEDRFENVRRAAELARLFSNQGIQVFVALMTPHEEMRQLARRIVGETCFRDIYVCCDFATCANRDPKGLYARAEAQKMVNFAGKDLLFEEPTRPAWLFLDSQNQEAQACMRLILHAYHTDQFNTASTADIEGSPRVDCDTLLRESASSH